MRKLLISMYHYTRDLTHSRYPRIKGLDIALFRKQIHFLKENYTIISMEQLIDAIKHRSKLPEESILLTFDDGYIDNYTYAFPILEEFGVQGSFFIPGKTFVAHQLLDVNKIHYILASASVSALMTALLKKLDFYRGDEYKYETSDILINKYACANRFDSAEVIFIKRILQTVLPEKLRNIISSELFAEFVSISETQLAFELYMTEEQIRTMHRHGMFIGLHGYDHYWLGNLSAPDAEKDISMALEALDEFIDKREWVMNYPYGSYNETVIDYISSHGACVGLTTEVRDADLDSDNVFTLPRLDCNDFPPKSDNYKKYLGD